MRLGTWKSERTERVTKEHVKHPPPPKQGKSPKVQHLHQHHEWTLFLRNSKLIFELSVKPYPLDCVVQYSLL